MRIAQKYFNLFIIICAAIAVIIIALTTIRYSQKQVLEFKNNLSEIDLNTIAFRTYLQADSLRISELAGSPVVIQFWATWSGKSDQVNHFLNEYQKAHPDLTVVAAAVRDGEEQIMEYLQENNFHFDFVEGTVFYQQIYVPGIPAQILIGRDGELFDTHIGDEIQVLKNKLNHLIIHE